MYEVFFSDAFYKKVRKIARKDPQQTNRIRKQLKILSKNPDHPSLRLHKLSGRNNWSVSVDRSVRIIINIEDNIIYFTDIGTHDEVY